MTGKCIDIDGNEVDPVDLTSADYMQYGKLLLRALFGGVFKDGVSDEQKEELFEHIEVLCFMRGIFAFDLDVGKMNGDVGSVMKGYSDTINRKTQEAANKMYAVEKAGEEINPNDAAVFDFLKSKGVAHMPDPPPLIDKPGLKEGLKKVALAMGIPEEEYDRIAAEAEAANAAGEPTPGCECPSCQEKRRLAEE